MKSLSAFILASLLVACKGEKEQPISSGVFEKSTLDMDSSYDLPQINESGELIAITYSSPQTYFEYHGLGFGLQYMIATRFAQTQGVMLRVELENDSATMYERLAKGEADFLLLDAPDSIQWITRDDSPLLAQAFHDWYTGEERKSVLAEIEKMKQRPRVRRNARPEYRSRSGGIISDYDDLFKRYASTIPGWDWQLMAAQCYQESAFDPNAQSWVGAQGLMQLMPGTARQMQVVDPFDPVDNISGAARYLRLLAKELDFISNRDERINFMLASYNGGLGHIQDAMALCEKYGEDKYIWANVSQYVLLLQSPQYYRDNVVKHGYIRGEETVNYVQQIRNRRRRY